MIRWWHGWQLSRAMDDDPSGEAAARYAARHPRCGRVKQSLDALEARLVADVPAWRNAGVRSRRLLRDADARRPRRPVIHTIGWTSAAAAVVIALTAALMLRTADPPKPLDQPAAGDGVVVAALARGTSAIEGPLNDEARRLAADTRAAARYALDALPSFTGFARPRPHDDL